ncbi:hydroxymethylbilane synthase [Legionella sp. W05-934-2]|jgi:hydroxymethylbilane synthase|uniref:hydroxymethylbilane synthase n=1 Tax=Legionella sp. W05-934-2 TaxID=1198649 RepID=UPI003461F7B2
MAKPIIIATRESELALWQANYVKQQLTNLFPDKDIQLLPMKTTGDKFLKDKLQAIGGKGLFVKELEEAILDGRADLAVHSMKDVPASFPQGLGLAAILERHNPFDALLCHANENLASLPQGAVIGTSSLRREAQIRMLRPDCQVLPLRGNIHTRIRKLQNNEFDAIILATSGLERMGLSHLIHEQFDAESMLPACGQGALGIECRTADDELIKMIHHLACSKTSVCINTERQVNALLGGNCHVPIAVYCHFINSNRLNLRAKIFAQDGRKCLSFVADAPVEDAHILADRCANDLLAQGAQALINQAGAHD